MLLDCYWFATGRLHRSQPLPAGGPRQLRIASARLPALISQAPSATPGLTSQVASSKSLPLHLSTTRSPSPSIISLQQGRSATQSKILSKHHLSPARSLWQTQSKILSKHHLSAARSLWQTQSKILSKHHLSAARSLWQTQSKILSNHPSPHEGDPDEPRKSHRAKMTNFIGGRRSLSTGQGLL